MNKAFDKSNFGDGDQCLVGGKVYIFLETSIVVNEKAFTFKMGSIVKFFHQECFHAKRNSNLHKKALDV